MGCNKLIRKFTRKRKHAKIAKDKFAQTERCRRQSICHISFVECGFAGLLDLLRSRLDPLERERIHVSLLKCTATYLPPTLVWNYLMPIVIWWHILTSELCFTGDALRRIWVGGRGRKKKRAPDHKGHEQKAEGTKELLRKPARVRLFYNPLPALKSKGKVVLEFNVMVYLTTAMPDGRWLHGSDGVEVVPL